MLVAVVGFRFIAPSSDNSIVNEKIMNVLCAADYPGGCLRGNGDGFIGYEIDIIEKILYENEKVKFYCVSADNIKHDIKSGSNDIGCGGWFYKSDGNIYSSPVITGITICDLVKGDWHSGDPVFIQSSTICADKAEDKYGKDCLRKYPDLRDCIDAYKKHIGPKRIIIDSINIDYIHKHPKMDKLVFDSLQEEGDYAICFLCKDAETKRDLDRRISRLSNVISQLNHQILIDGNWRKDKVVKILKPINVDSAIYDTSKVNDSLNSVINPNVLEDVVKPSELNEVHVNESNVPHIQINVDQKTNPMPPRINPVPPKVNPVPPKVNPVPTKINPMQSKANPMQQNANQMPLKVNPMQQKANQMPLKAPMPNERSSPSQANSKNNKPNLDVKIKDMSSKEV